MKRPRTWTRALLTLAACLLLSLLPLTAAAQAQDDPDVPEPGEEGRDRSVDDADAPAPAPAADDSDDDAPEPGWESNSKLPGELHAEFVPWFAQASGLDLELATRNDPISPLDVGTESLDPSTESRVRYSVGYKLKGGHGDFVFTWYAQEVDERVEALLPAQFVFGTSLAARPLNAGIFDDGLADGYTANILIRLRDLRLSYYRDAWQTDRTHARWFVGYRRISQQTSRSVLYRSLSPNLPLTTRSELLPVPDVVSLSSEFTARGAEGGFDVSVPLWSRDVTLEAGLSIAALRGRVTRAHSTTVSRYTPAGDPDTTLDPTDPNLFSVPTDQVQDIAAIRAANDSASSLAAETFLGFRWRVWRGLQVLGGFRGLYVSDMVQELRVTDLGVRDENTGVYSVTGAERSSSDASYEGYYVGVAYRY